MEKEDQASDELIGFGNELVSWQVNEYERHDRGLWWYIIATIAGVALIVYAIASSNFLFAVIILMIGVIMFLSNMEPPTRIQILLTDNGIIIGQRFHPYREIKNFAVVYEPPEVKALYLNFHSNWRPLLSIPLENTDPVAVRDCLLAFVVEDLSRTEESLTDFVSRMYKL